MAKPRNYNPDRKDEVFDTLRREILAARLKVTLDKELDRTTSDMVKRLAGMKLPPLVYQVPQSRVQRRRLGFGASRRSAESENEPAQQMFTAG